MSGDEDILKQYYAKSKRSFSRSLHVAMATDSATKCNKQIQKRTRLQLRQTELRHMQQVNDKVLIDSE
eukprot:6194612-Pleurochrysis_carterae.AAC.1